MQKYNQNLRYKNLPSSIRKNYKQMGYFKELNGIISRYHREADNWKGHINNCKSFITDNIVPQQFSTIAVLGSGWLLDVPVEALVGQCNQLWLIDLHHPKEVVHTLRHYENIWWAEQDVTGGAIEVIYNASKSSKPLEAIEALLPDIVNFQPAFNSPPDLLISINILSQLECILLDYLAEKIRGFPHRLKVEISRALQQAHIHLLSQYPSLLITDINETVVKNSDLSASVTSYIQVPLPDEKLQSEWDWHFDTRGYYVPNAQTTLHVKAFNLIR